MYTTYVAYVEGTLVRTQDHVTAVYQRFKYAARERRNYHVQTRARCVKTASELLQCGSSEHTVPQKKRSRTARLETFTPITETVAAFLNVYTSVSSLAVTES
ncbi:hypothetical protein J6590_041272 [Homalodisca vitripennis]|nr:hypothetical protein J6590_041272 [Homalodisca vitripennis]